MNYDNFIWDTSKPFPPQDPETGEELHLRWNRQKLANDGKTMYLAGYDPDQIVQVGMKFQSAVLVYSQLNQVHYYPTYEVKEIVERRDYNTTCSWGSKDAYFKAKCIEV